MDLCQSGTGTGKRRGGGMIRFIIRASFWGFLALIALPSLVPYEPASTKAATADTDMTGASLHALRLANGLRADVATLCERRPGVCDSGQALTETAMSRARQGLTIAADWAAARGGPPANP